MRTIVLSLLCLIWAFTDAAPALNSRIDSFHVAHYDLHLDISNISSRSIAGYCTVKVVSKIDSLKTISLDLLQLNVVRTQELTVRLSITDTLQTLGEASYIYNDTLLKVKLPIALNFGDSAEIIVSYNGKPANEKWGGFFFTDYFAYNMGVGFVADPHSFGRAWFPCVDNFIDKALYDLYITTSPANKAMCNGLLQDKKTEKNGNITWHWHTTHPLPSYLVSVAVGNYATVQSIYSGIRDTFPVVLAAPPKDTLKMINSFVHLNAALKIFELAYGPQPFEKVGFTEVPFKSGAMEHAGNIAYPSFAVDGSIDHESILVHELSHHWWGDLVTCETEKDMWLNEGWATYSVSLFHQFVYGEDSYKKEMRANHFEVLHNAHVHDKGYRAVYGIPHEFTYGTHVYRKGADVVHTLRSYLGDSVFFRCIKSYLQAHAYSNASTIQFRDDISACSGRDMREFFTDWVFSPGFTHFSIDSYIVSPSAESFNVSVYIRQKLKNAPRYYNGVPLEITFFDNAYHKVVKKVEMNGRCGVFATTLPFKPVYVALDMEEKISDAITDKYLLINTPGNYDFEEALMTMDVAAVKDTALVRVEHNWVSPDAPKAFNPDMHMSVERYWKVDGIWPKGFEATATIKYEGDSTHTDFELLTRYKGPIKLLYRATVKDDWTIYPDYTVQKGGDDKSGEIIIKNLVKGEYVLAVEDKDPKPNQYIPLDDIPCSTLKEIQ